MRTRVWRRLLGACVLTGLLIVAAPAAAEAAMKYAGKTDEGQKITFVRDGKKLKKVRTLLFTTCFENGGSYRTKSGFELFHPPGKFTAGREGKKQASAYSSLAGQKVSFTYRFLARLKKRRATGRLSHSFFYSVYDPYWNTITFWNCMGQTKFTAKRR